MKKEIRALDKALDEVGEWITLRRTVGSGANIENVDVDVRARVDAVTTEQLVAGIIATDLNVIMSPTQINNAQWPGGHVQAVPPFNVDQRIPRIGGPDKILLRGGPPRTITFVSTNTVDDEVVRIILRISG